MPKIHYSRLCTDLWNLPVLKPKREQIDQLLPAAGAFAFCTSPPAFSEMIGAFRETVANGTTAKDCPKGAENPFRWKFPGVCPVVRPFCRQITGQIRNNPDLAKSTDFPPRWPAFPPPGQN